MEQSDHLPLQPSDEALCLVPETMAVVYRIMPISYTDGVLTIAATERNEERNEDLRKFLLVKTVQTIISTRQQIDRAITECYVKGGLEVGDYMPNLDVE